MAYAEGTLVTPERSQMEIASVIRKYGAESFVTGWDRGNGAVVSFVAHRRQIRFMLALPTEWTEYRKTPTGQIRYEQAARRFMESEIRRRWRSLLLAIKAKFEVIETGISTFEAEFLPYTVMPDGRTVAEHILPKVDQAIRDGLMPQRLLAIEAGDPS